jgi:3-hydroxyisobutyrate dehydrogenase-like beta-hydroxyacid dehydrogenase
VLDMKQNTIIEFIGIGVMGKSMAALISSISLKT